MQVADLFYVAGIFIIGLIIGKIFLRYKMPVITGYLIAGLIIGPSILNLIPKETVKELSIFTDIVLTFVAFSIGSEFNLRYLKKLGIKPFKITFITSIITFIVVFIALYLFNFDLKASLLIASISTATSPVSTMIIVNHYKAKGKLTNMLMSVVAIDDIVAILIFGITMAIVKSLTLEDANLIKNLILPISEIATSIFVGTILGFLLAVFIKIFKHSEYDLTIIIIFVLFALSISNILNTSALLTAVIMGTVFINFSKEKITKKVLKVLDIINPSLFILFFVLSGISLNINKLETTIMFAIVYIIARALGKIIGARLASKRVNAPKSVEKYLGFTLLPQAGIAIGLSMEASKLLGNDKRIEGIILSAILVYELIGPLITKKVLKKAKEIN